MAPFRGLCESVVINGQSVLDASVLFAMIIYGIVALALGALIEWLSQRLSGCATRQHSATPPAPPQSRRRGHHVDHSLIALATSTGVCGHPVHGPVVLSASRPRSTTARRSRSNRLRGLIERPLIASG